MNPRTTIVRDFLATMSTTSKVEILARLEKDTDAIEAYRRRPPAARVTLRELVRQRTDHELARGTAYHAIGAVYRDLTTVTLHDLSEHGRVDVIRVGRNPDQDLQVLDDHASREHGLILYDSMVLYFDYGTLIEPEHGEHRPLGRHGSRNGSYLNATSLISNSMIPWFEEDAIHFGTFRANGNAYGFQLVYRGVADEN